MTRYLGYCLLFEGQADAQRLILSATDSTSPAFWRATGFDHNRSHAMFSEIINSLVIDQRLLVEGTVAFKSRGTFIEDAPVFPVASVDYKLIAHNQPTISFLQHEKQLAACSFAMFSDTSLTNQDGWVGSDLDTRVAGVVDSFGELQETLSVNAMFFDLVAKIVAEPASNLGFTTMRVDDSVKRHLKRHRLGSGVVMTRPGTLVGVALSKPLTLMMVWVGFNIYLIWTNEPTSVFAAIEQINSMPMAEANHKQARILCGALAPVTIQDDTVCLPLCSMRRRILERWTQQRTNRALAMTDLLQLSSRRMFRCTASFRRETGAFNDYSTAQKMMEDETDERV